MYIIIAKGIAAVSIFLLTVVTGLLPLKIAKNKAHFFSLGDAFATGVFLSASLLHLLPDADKGFRYVLGESSYPVAQLICITTFVLLLFVEHRIFSLSKHYYSSQIVAPSLLISLLTIHSLIEGAAIGSGINLAEITMLFAAVIAHKGSESFALGINLHRYNLTPKNIKKIITLFSCMTPLGIFVAAFIMFALQTSSGHTLGSIFSAITAGTFLYLGTAPLVEGTRSFENLSEIIALVFGVTLMALVIIWV